MTSTDPEFHENPEASLRFVDSKEVVQVQVGEVVEHHRPHRCDLCHNRGRSLAYEFEMIRRIYKRIDLRRGTSSSEDSISNQQGSAIRTTSDIIADKVR